MKIGIAIDAWKLGLFDEQLKKAGYSYENCGMLPGNATILLRVVTDDKDGLMKAAKAAQQKAALLSAQITTRPQ